MSKMSKDFKVKSALRCMADGGMIGGLAGKRQQVLDGAERAAVRPPVAPVAPVAAPPAPVGGMISDGVVSRPAPAPVVPAQPQGVFSRLRKAVGMANGGSPWDSSYAPGGSLSMQKATPRPQPTIVLGGAPASPVQPVAQPAAPSPTATPSPALAPPVSSTPTAPTHSIATANLQFGDGDLGTVGDWAGKPKTSATGYPVLRSGGRVQGPGGPREDKVGPVMLSNEEYVLPAKTVEAMGGPEELDAVVQETNDGREPHGVEQRGLRGMAAGGTFYADMNGNVSDEPWKRVPRPVPPVNAAPPATAPQPSPFPERDITPPKIEAEVVRNAPQSAKPSAMRAAGEKLSKRVNSPFMKSIGMPVAAGFAANETRQTETDDYYRRFGIDPKVAGQTHDMKGNVIDKTPLERFGSDLAARSLGAASDLGNVLTGTLAGNLYRDKQGGPVTPKPQPKNMWARDARDVAPESVLRQEASNAALERAKMLMDRNTPDTGGQIHQMGNTFVGGQGGERGKELENIEAEKARARYANDAQGMYAAIQGHIANGDLETANKLAWDSNSRALVNQGFAARQAARQQAAQPNEMDAINARYDKQAEKLSKYFRSDAAKGNLAKHLVNLEERRALELGAFRNTQSTLRGQNMAAESDAAKQASAAAIAAQRTQADAAKAKIDQGNKDRDYKLNVAKFGAEEANRQRDEGTARENTAMGDVDAFAAKAFVTPDNKPDLAMAASFLKFMASDQGKRISSLPATERRAAMAEAARQLKIRDLKNSSGGVMADRTDRFSDVVGARDPQLNDVLRAGIVPTAKAWVRQRTIGGGRMVEFGDGQVRYEGDLGSNDDLDTNTFINQSTLRNKK